MFSRWVISGLVAVVVSTAFVPKVGAGVISDPFDGTSFDANTWQVNLPTMDFQPLGLASNASATVSGGVANLAGRAQLVAKQAFAAPITISGDVRIINAQNDYSEIGYPDGESITVATRTNATYDYNHYGEALNSVLFRATYSLPGQFTGGGSNYDIQTWDGTTLTTLAHASGASGVEFGPLQWLRFTITDDGTNVSFRLVPLVNGVPRDTKSVSMTASTAFAGSGHQAAFYDRESPSAQFFPRSLQLDNVSITPTPEPGTLFLVVFCAFGALARGPLR